MSKRILIIIPAYNEAAVIGEVIGKLKQDLSQTENQADILVVDDGSSDKTAQLAEQAGAKVVKHILNSKTGAATSTGISYAQMNNYDLAVSQDADGQHLAEDVIKGIELMNKGQHDLLIGSRLINNEGMSRVKRIGNRGLSMITNMLYGMKVTDSQSGLRVFSKEAIDQLRWKSNGFEFCSEMIWRAKQKGLRVGEFPIKAVYTEYSMSKGQNNWNALNIIKSLIERRVMEVFGE